MCLLSPLLLAPGLARAQIGNYSSHRLTATGLEVVAGADTLLFTLYAPDILRVDYAPAGHSARDTSLVVIRSPAPETPFTVSDEGRALRLRTAAMELLITRNPVRLSYWDATGALLLAETSSGGFSAAGNRRRVRFARPPELHFYGTGQRGIGPDLKGQRFTTYNTQAYGYSSPLETMGINVPFLATSGGFGLYFESTFPATLELGRTSPDGFSYETEGGELSYFVLLGADLPAQLERYTGLTGRQPLPPRWALGYLQSKFGYRNREAVEAMARTMRARRIPADAVILDLYWFSRMGDLAWNTGAFPDPAGMIRGLRDNGFKTLVISEPYFTEHCTHFPFLTGAGRNFVGRTTGGDAYRLPEWWSCGCDALLFDMTNPAGRRWLWERHEEFMAAGVAGLWTDLGEPETHPGDMVHALGSTARVHNVYNLLWARAMFEGFARYRPNDRLVNLTRSGYAGIQRYGVFTWSGDVARSFSGLAVQRPILLNMGLSGLGYHGSDLGGFVGRTSPELYVRWMQFGAFNPVMRAHGVDTQPTEPWGYGPEAEAIARDFIRLRYQLLPYLYTLARENHETGMPIVRPLMFHDPNDPLLTNDSEAFLLGPDLLVAPVVVEGQRRKDVYLPQGRWIHYWDDSLFVGGRRVSVEAPLNRIPLFVRAGAILPLQPVVDFVGQATADTLSLEIFPPPHGEPELFTLYEDDGMSLGYQRGEFARMPLRQQVVRGDAGADLVIRIGPAEGGFPGMAIRRTVLAAVHRLPPPAGPVRLDATPLPVRASREELLRSGDGSFHDPLQQRLWIKFEHDVRRGSVLEIAGIEPPPVDGPGRLVLKQNHPNPFRGETGIDYELPSAGHVRLEVVNPGGGRVAVLVDAHQAAGPHRVNWDGRSERGELCPPGVYFLRLTAAGAIRSRKVTIVP